MCGDISIENMWRRPARRASPLEMVIRGVHQHAVSGSVDGPRGASGRPREQATRRPVPPVITDRGRCLVSGNTAASAADRRRQRHLSLRSAFSDHYYRLISIEQVTQVRLTGDAL